jgi:hypothetical protein
MGNQEALAAEQTLAPATASAAHTPGPWEYIASNENHGPYVVAPWGSDIADCYTMSNLSDRAVCNGGTSKPIPFQHEAADANARLIAAAPDMLAALKDMNLPIDAARQAYEFAPNSYTAAALAEVLNAHYRAQDAIAKATGVS